MKQPTALGGTLRRVDDGWVWSDGQPAEHVRDLDPSRHYNLRIRDAGGSRWVEVPVGVARENDDLAWVRSGGYGTSYDGDRVGPEHRVGGRVADPRVRCARVFLVPVDDWDNWAAMTVIGAEWDRDHESAILSRARQLGWCDD